MMRPTGKTRFCSEKTLLSPRGKRLPILAFFLSLISILSIPLPGFTQTKTVRLSIATGGTGGIFYVFGGGIASLISKRVPGVEATAEVTAASVDNCKLVMAQKAELAFVLADNAYEAILGIEKFKSMGKIPLRNLAVLYPAVSHIVALEGGGIKKVTDLKGKRVSLGAPGSGSEALALKILEISGLDLNKDIRRERLSVAESAGALKDRKIDAFFWGGGVPTAAVLDLAATPGIKIKLIPHDELLEKLNQKYGPVYYRLVIPKDAYPGMTQPVSVLAQANMLVCHEKFDENLAYEILNAIFTHREDLKAVYKEAGKVTPENAVVGSSIPFHPGAIKYYKEKKVMP
ncbi:MAG: TAXI family TRAP transporter solute-binding subunit [Deltaproteobacteria bacterium]|nr:TAXI family TRAP transporter solute-binding subunit [Deltaproteobacteria bacterium]